MLHLAHDREEWLRCTKLVSLDEKTTHLSISPVGHAAVECIIVSPMHLLPKKPVQRPLQLALKDMERDETGDGQGPTHEAAPSSLAWLRLRRETAVGRSPSSRLAAEEARCDHEASVVVHETLSVPQQGQSPCSQSGPPLHEASQRTSGSPFWAGPAPSDESLIIIDRRLPDQAAEPGCCSAVGSTAELSAAGVGEDAILSSGS